MVFPSLSLFAGPLSGAGQPTTADPPRDGGSGLPSSLSSRRRASQLRRWGGAASRGPRLILTAPSSSRFSAVPALISGSWVHRRSLPGHADHHHSGRRARHHAHLQQQRREQRRKRIASANASDGEPGDDCGGHQPKNVGYFIRGGFGEYTVAAEMPRPASRGKLASRTSAFALCASLERATGLATTLSSGPSQCWVPGSAAQWSVGGGSTPS